MTTQIGFQIGFKEKTDIWLFPESVPSLNATSGSITYTMSGNSSSLAIGNSDAVGELVRALMSGITGAVDAATGEAVAAAKQSLGNLWTQFPEPFKSIAEGAAGKLSELQYSLESLRVTLNFTTVAGAKQYKLTYEMGISVLVGESAPGPFSAFSLKRVYLKLAG